MFNHLNQEGFWIILATIIGFAISELYNALKNKKNIKLLQELLLDEMDSNFHQINHKISILNKMIEALDDNKFLSGKSVAFSNTTFNHHFAKIVKKFTPIERDNIRHIYNLLCQIDTILNNFDKNYKDDLDHIEVRKNSLEGINKANIIILRGLKDSLENAQSLISSFKEGKPIDIYQRIN